MKRTLACAFALLGAVAPAQVPQRPQVPSPGAPRGEAPETLSPLAPRTTQPELPRYREGFQGLESVYPQYPSFPTYPKGYGPAERLLGFLFKDKPDARLYQPVPLPSGAPPSWPSWLRGTLPTGQRTPAADRALLVRTAERVWLLEPEEPVFVPLYFWDKLRVIGAGSTVEVRDKGEFEVVFHDGALLRSRGPVRIALTRLTPELAEMELEVLRRVWLLARKRPFRVVLPDRSVLDIEDTEVYLEGEDGRGAVFNHGRKPVRWTTRSGTVELPPAQRADLLLAGSATEMLPAGLRLSGPVRAVRQGRMLEVFGEGEGGRVTWSGATLAVPPGGSVRLDPLAGTDFPERER